MLFALISPRAQRACTFDISAERNVWLQSPLRSFAIVCDYMETALFAIVCDLRSAIVCDYMETSLESLKEVNRAPGNPIVSNYHTQQNKFQDQNSFLKNLSLNNEDKIDDKFSFK